ncbi:MAG: single-stranded DNA-binding protein [Microbacteriaceae bacterium]|nr:single-stranded DNA-binding protein [Microbacteriaceae bacterium]
MSDLITVTGVVATEPRSITTSEGVSITSFRLASQDRKIDRATGKWTDGDTNWYTVTSFRNLAKNVASSVKKGERVIVAGKLRIREWDSGEKQGTNVEIEAAKMGHDLNWGVASFEKKLPESVLTEWPSNYKQAGGTSTEETSEEEEEPLRQTA